MKYFKTLTLCAITVAGSAIMPAQTTFAQVESDSEREVRAAEKQLSDLRRQVADQKIPISKRLTELENEVQTKRAEYDVKVRAAENYEVDLNDQREKVDAIRTENVYVRNQMSAYVKAFSTRIHESELPSYQTIIEESEQALERSDTSDSDKLAAQVAVIQASIERVRDIIGGHRFDGSALSSSGTEVPGQFVLAGPFAYFGDGVENNGFAEGQVNSVHPIILSKGIKESSIAAISNITQTGNGFIPVDPTEGNAVKMSLTKETFLEHIAAGGVSMYPIIAIGIIAALIIAFKFFDIMSVKRPKAGSIQQIIDALNSGNKQKALEISNSVDGPFGNLLVAGVEHADQEKEILEEVMYEQLLAAQPKLERFIGFIALTAAAAPLLGLLGTVTGMIDTFKLITVFGTGDAASLSSGISVALITTEYGLRVAIPALVFQAILTKQAKGKLGEMEQASVALVNGLEKKS